MDLWQALVLSIVQGITEFLPISSSGHLILVPHLMGWPDQGLLFDIAANTGTLLSVLVYFRKDVAELLSGFWRSLKERGVTGNPMGRMAWYLGWATIPAGIVGLLVKDTVATLARDPMLIAINAIVFGLLMGLADHMGKRQRRMDSFRLRDALLIGVAQALALNPGTSRSGITMTAGLFAGFDRETAARFSFLLSIPIGVMAGLLDVVDLYKASPTAGEWLFLGVGLIGSALSGILVIHWLLSWLRSHSLTVFMVYRLLLGAAIFALVL